MRSPGECGARAASHHSLEQNHIPPPPCLPPYLRTEHKVLQVLHQASQRISADLDSFWAAYMHLDPEANGYIDISKASRFFKDLFHVSAAQGRRVGHVAEKNVVLT